MTVYRVGTVLLKDRTLRHGRDTYDVAGATAQVETDGDVVARFTATRILFLGVFALAFKKKKDKRGLYLMVEGPDYAFVAELNPKKDMTKSREVAQAINSAGKRYQPLSEPEQVAVANSVPVEPTTAESALTQQVADPPLEVAPPPPPSIPAGWYPDPAGSGQRYWDGTAWTTHTHP